MADILDIVQALSSTSELLFEDIGEHKKGLNNHRIDSLSSFFTDRSTVPHETLSGSVKSLPSFIVDALQIGWHSKPKESHERGITIIDSRPFRHGPYVNIIYLIEFDSESYLCQIGGMDSRLCSILHVKRTVVYILDCRQSASIRSLWALLLQIRLDFNHSSLSASPINSDIVLCEGVSSHLGTALVNEYSGLLISEEIARSSGVDYSVCSFYHSFANLSVIFKEHSSRLHDFSFVSNIDVWNAIGRGRYMFIRPSCNYVVQPLVVHRYFSASSRLQQNIELSPPACIINFRQHTRTCPVSPFEFEQLYKAINTVMPMVRILFDGMTSPTLRKFNKNEAKILEQEVNFYTNLSSGMPPNSFQIVAGMTMAEKVRLFRNSFLSIQTYGSGFLYPYLLGIDTIMLSSFSHALNGKIYNELYDSCIPSFRLHVISQSFPTIAEVDNIGLESFPKIRNNTDLLKSGGYNENYVIDWKLLGNYILNHFSAKPAII